MLNGNLHARFLRGNSGYLLYRPVLHGWKIDKHGQYYKEQYGC